MKERTKKDIEIRQKDDNMITIIKKDGSVVVKDGKVVNKKNKIK